VIEGVAIIDLVVNEDDRGSLTVVARSVQDSRPNGVIESFGEVYVVCDPVRHTIRAFHKHHIMWDYFCILNGSAKFVLRDDRIESATYQQMMTIVISGRKPRLITVPPGVFHGWMSLEDNTMMLSIADVIYNPSAPDEVRVSPESFGDVWTVKGR
jgi:dTDP-4-dehydrorhamnose 3,5-epimerase